MVRKEKKEVKTVILLMPCGEYYCGKTYDVENCIDEFKSKYHAGFFSFKKNKGKVKIVYVTVGDHVRSIKMCGVKNFMMVIKDYDPVFDGIIQLLS